MKDLRRHLIHKASHKHIVTISLIAALQFIILSFNPTHNLLVYAQIEGFNSEIHYNEAVPNFLNAITDATSTLKDENELMEIFQWEDETKLRIQEFLDDLVQISIALENVDSTDEVFENYQLFVDKWTAIVAAYPGLEELDGEISALLNQLFNGLPKIKQSEFGDIPLANLSDYYNEMMEKNAWGAGEFFSLGFLNNGFRKKVISEVVKEQTVGGVYKEVIVRKEVLISENDKIVFMKIIENDEIIDKFIVPQAPTLIHEVLMKASEDGLDQDLIDALSALVILIDQEMMFAKNNGVLDQDVYNVIYGLVDTVH